MIYHYFYFRRNPLLHSDIIYKMTAGAKRYSEVCTVTQAKAKEVIRERRAALQDSVSISYLLTL